ncbi:MAG: DUF2905 domain-containing protein [Bacteroidales bacterium]|nr:DUF2905 domain-containing protein [Bacteroidales bacterium]
MMWKIFMIIGFVFIIIGVILWAVETYFPNIKKLPGDFVFQFKNVTVFFPLMTSIILSILLSIILYILYRFIK